jgi:DeoR/GlpR family transcriptional regulator of sugar metabolism
VAAEDRRAPVQPPLGVLDVGVEDLVDTLNAAADSAQRVVGLLDSTKFERSSLLSIRSATALDLIITDARLDPEVVAAFRAAGVNLQVVSGVAEPHDPEAD